MEITLDKWDTAVDSRATAFLVGVREAARLMREDGRIIAITFTPGGSAWKLAAVGCDGSLDLTLSGMEENGCLHRSH